MSKLLSNRETMEPDPEMTPVPAEPDTSEGMSDSIFLNDIFTFPKELEYDDDEDDSIGSQPNEEYEKGILAYLLRYEHMVLQQESEKSATSAHLRPLFDRLRVIGGDEEEDYKSEEDERSNFLSGEGSVGSTSTASIDTEPLSYSALTNDDDESDPLHDCDVSNLLSLNGIRRALYVLEGSNPGKANEVMKTDKQLMMVLKELSSHECVVTDDEDELMVRKNSISFPEFWHFYKTVVNGMLVMQMLPTSQNVKSNVILLHRNRTRERILMMIKAFSDGESKTEKEDVLIDEMKELIENKELLLTRQTSKYTKDINDLRSSVESIGRSRKRWQIFALLACTSVVLLALPFVMKPKPDLSITDRIEHYNVDELQSTCSSSEETKIIDHQKRLIKENVHRIRALSVFEAQNKECRAHLEDAQSILKAKTKDLHKCDGKVNTQKQECRAHLENVQSILKAKTNDLHECNSKINSMHCTEDKRSMPEPKITSQEDDFKIYEDDHLFSEDEHMLSENVYESQAVHLANKYGSIQKIVKKHFFVALGTLGGIGGATTFVAPKVAALLMKTGAFSWIVRGITIIGNSMVHFFLP